MIDLHLHLAVGSASSSLAQGCAKSSSKKLAGPRKWLSFSTTGCAVAGATASSEAHHRHHGAIDHASGCGRSSMTRLARGPQRLPPCHGAVTLLRKSHHHRGTFAPCLTPDLPASRRCSRRARLPCSAPPAIPTRISGRPIAYMKAQGFQGRALPGQPEPRRSAGAEGLSLGRRPAGNPRRRHRRDRRRTSPCKAIEDLAERGVKAALMFTAGFAEMDEAGEAAQNRMVAAARKHGMRILGPNCLGVFDSRTAYYATFSSSFDSGWPVPGRIGIASQSGAYGTHLYTLARNRGIGASLCIMTGNEADVTVGECIGWLAENPEVDVIAVYAEGIRESRRADRRIRGGARGEEADRHAEGRPQRTRHQGGEVAHRLDRRRRRGDRGGDGRVRRACARATPRRCWTSRIPRRARSIRRATRWASSPSRAAPAC